MLLDERLLYYYNNLHQNAEIAWKEEKTTKLIAGWIKESGGKPNFYTETTGVWTEIGHGSPKIGIRVDIDALWQEVNGVEQANHSCGHDAHMSIGLTLFHLLMEKKDNLNCTIRFIFQPAEEVGAGALKTIEEDLIGDLDYLYGLHLRPIEELKTGEFSVGIQHGASKCIEGEIIGEESHAARPHLSQNAIEIGMSIIENLNTIHHNPMIPASIKFTEFHAGTGSHNTIPGKANFIMDVRAQTNEVMKDITNSIYRIMKGTEIIYGAKINLNELLSLKAAVVSPIAEECMRKAVLKNVSKRKCKKTLITPGGEDFHMYTYKYPNLKATMLGVGCNLSPGLHHPNMTFDKSILIKAVYILEQVIQETVLMEQELNNQESVLI